MAHINTEEKFISAVEIIRRLPKSGPIQPSNDTKLKFYSYFKQATEGPCDVPKPGFWEVVNRAKWDAWNKLGDMSKEEAMKNYVDAFLKTLQNYSLDDLDDPSVLNEHLALIAPYIDDAPKELQEMLMNGKAKKPLNNNSEDHLEKSVASNSSKDYNNEYTGKLPDGYHVPLNGHNINGNDSDSDEFSDTLERVNEDESPETTLSVSKSMNNNNPLINAKGPNILNVRGGLDHRVGAGDNNSPAGGPSGSRGNGLSRQPRSSDFSLPGASNSSLIGGAGGNRRSGGDYPTELSSEVGEQLAMAVIRLQHIMEQVVVRLDSLETLLTERREKENSRQVSTKKQSRWSFFGISPKLAIIILAWPFIAQWLMYVIRKRQRQQ